MPCVAYLPRVTSPARTEPSHPEGVVPSPSGDLAHVAGAGGEPSNGAGAGDEREDPGSDRNPGRHRGSGGGALL